MDCLALTPYGASCPASRLHHLASNRRGSRPRQNPRPRLILSAMIRITISAAAFDAIAATLPSNVGVEQNRAPNGDYFIWLDPRLCRPAPGHARAGRAATCGPSRRPLLVWVLAAKDEENSRASNGGSTVSDPARKTTAAVAGVLGVNRPVVLRPSEGVTLVTHYLRYKYDHKEDQKVRTLPFSTEPEAVIAACAVIAEGTGWDFEIINHDNETVANDIEIRNRCKQSRTGR